MENPWLFAGGAAAMGLVASCWEYVRSIYQQISGRLIVRISASGYQSDALLLYLNAKFEASKFGPRSYAGWLLHVQPRRRTQLVAMEVVGDGGRLYWSGWKPLWVSKSDGQDSDIEEGVSGRSDYQSNSLRLTFIRGFFRADRLILDASEFYNARIVSVDNDSRQRRHYIRHVHGTAGKQYPPGFTRGRHDYPATAGDTRACMHHRPLGWEMSELGFQNDDGASSIDQLSLSNDALELVQEARFWKENEPWYRERTIPWRRGWLLHGEPGTGKTALIRAVAEDLDLPVFVYDLATLRNDELQTAWSQMLCEVPCMAVIEDIDAVFNRRDNIACKDGNGALTFDCLLNCLDGIERSNGLCLAITTNRLDHIDDALGRPDAVSGSTRPGRIDRTLYIGPLTAAARHKMAQRILQDSPDVQAMVVDQGDGDTAAQFQERCSKIALELFWGSRQAAPCLADYESSSNVDSSVQV